MTADLAFRAALEQLTNALAELQAPAMIIGGVAVIAAGVPRDTIDIDATILGKATDLDEVLAVLERHDIVPRIDEAREFARQRQVLLLRHEPSGVTIELTFAWLPFEEQALEQAVEVDFEGIRARVARPEDLIVYKAAAWRDRDRSDIERLLVLHLHGLDLERIRKLIHEIAGALGEPGRLEEFDQMVRRARGDYA